MFFSSLFPPASMIFFDLHDVPSPVDSSTFCSPYYTPLHAIQRHSSTTLNLSQTQQTHHHSAAHTGGRRRNDLLNLHGGRRPAARLDQLVQSQSADPADAGGEHRTHGRRHLPNLLHTGLHRHPFRPSVRILLQGHERRAEKQKRGAPPAGHSAASAV